MIWMDAISFAQGQYPAGLAMEELQLVHQIASRSVEMEY